MLLQSMCTHTIQHVYCAIEEGILWIKKIEPGPGRYYLTANILRIIECVYANMSQGKKESKSK